MTADKTRNLCRVSARIAQRQLGGLCLHRYPCRGPSKFIGLADGARQVLCSKTNSEICSTTSSKNIELKNPILLGFFYGYIQMTYKELELHLHLLGWRQLRSSIQDRRIYSLDCAPKNAWVSFDTDDPERGRIIAKGFPERLRNQSYAQILEFAQERLDDS